MHVKSSNTRNVKMTETIQVYYKLVIPVPYPKPVRLPGGGVVITPGSKPSYHKIIVYTQSNGTQYFIEAFPEIGGNAASGLAYSIVNSGDPSNFNEFDTVVTVTPYLTP